MALLNSVTAIEDGLLNISHFTQCRRFVSPIASGWQLKLLRVHLFINIGNVSAVDGSLLVLLLYSPVGRDRYGGLMDPSTDNSPGHTGMTSAGTMMMEHKTPSQTVHMQFPS